MTALYSLLLGAAQPVTLPFERHLTGDGWQVIWADSRWGKEYYLTRHTVPADGFRLESTFGRGGARFKPWLVLHQPATGRGLSIHLAWPGNWRLEAVPRGDGLDLLADTIPSGLPVIDTVGGLPLPGAVVAEFTGEADEGSRQINRFCRERLLRRPAEPWPLVMYNTWYDRWQNLSEAHLLESVAAAAEVGCELFVVDAGWYGAHDDWSRALGDWTINQQRLPRGLGPVRDAARAAGMRFGLWVEIECAHPESAVVREHPEWVLGGQQPASGRTCLDFGNPAALAWATGELDRIMREIGPDYLKMDFNTDLAVPLDQPEPLYGHYRGLAALWRHLRETYPTLIVENCSSGSLRADLFIAALTDTHWVSDEVANVANLGMNLGATWLFPPEYNNHWTCNPQAGDVLDLESCFTVNCLGQLGLSGDIAAWDARTRWHAADRIALYQQIRGLLARADVHHLTPPFDPAAPAGFQAVLYRDSAGPEAVLFAFQGGADGLTATVPVRGLEPDSTYQFELPTTGARQHVATGAELAGGLSIEFAHRGASAVIRFRPAAGDSPGSIARAGEVGEVRWQGVDPTSLSLTWPPVDDAESYVVQLTAADGTVREEVSHAPRYVATGLDPGGVYLARVGARQPGRFAGALSEPVELICAASAAASGELWREPWLSATAGWGSVRRNRSIEGLALRLGGVEHGEGIGTHAASRIVFDVSGLTGEPRRFRALVGVDDSAAGARGEASKVIFSVAADGAELWRSPALRVGDAAIEVDLEVPAGTRELALLVDPAGGIDFDHADWIRPRLEEPQEGRRSAAKHRAEPSMPVALIPLLAHAPPHPFADAVAVWHFADLHDSAGADSALTSGGAAAVGVELSGAEREASLARGGDGRAARCDGGWFDAGQGAGGELNLTGGAMTLLIRLRDPAGAWDTSLFSKHGGHDKLVYNLFTADLGGGMILGFELGTSELRGMVQVKLPLRYVDATAWHDVIARYDGATLELYCDGALVDSAPVTGALRGGNPEPCLIGAESVGGTPARPFRGELDHAALWQRALTDAEIVQLTAGAGPAVLAAYQAARDEERRMTLERLAADPLRPRFHFMPPAHWMNDPNGVVQFAGRYHMFYQHNPDGAWHANMHWGHAVSDDLVHWEHLPIALAPTAGTYDQGGIWSGSAVDADGVLTLMYTGVMPESQCLATAVGGVVEFAKHPANPVIAAPPEGLATTGFRDPCLWREADGWHVLIGSGIRDVGGAALHYRSIDLATWDYLGPLLVGDRAVTGEMWECPDFFPLGGGHALMVSVHGTVLWMLGDYDGRTFSPTADGNCDWGGHWYAAQECRDEAGRHLAWGWIWEARPRETQIAAGWAGVMSLPRVLTRRDHGTLGQEPAPEYERLRGAAWTSGPIELGDGGQVILEPRGDQLELRLMADVPAGATLGLKLRATPDGKEETLLLLDRAADTCSIDRRQSSLDESTGRDLRGGPVRRRAGADEVRVFVDRSVIEVFVNGETCLTSRIYPTRADSLGLSLFATGGAVRVEQVTVWPMADAT